MILTFPLVHPVNAAPSLRHRNHLAHKYNIRQQPASNLKNDKPPFPQCCVPQPLRLLLMAATIHLTTLAPLATTLRLPILVVKGEKYWG